MGIVRVAVGIVPNMMSDHDKLPENPLGGELIRGLKQV